MLSKLITTLCVLSLPLGFCQSEHFLEHEEITPLRVKNADWRESIHADITGVKKSRHASKKFSEVSELVLDTWNARNGDYKNNDFNRSKEDLFKLSHLYKLSSNLHLFNQFTSYTIRQDIKSFGQTVKDNPKYSSLAFSSGVEYSLLPQVNIHLSQGIATCSTGSDFNETLPIGGVKVSFHAKLGSAYLEAAQNADGDNSLAGLYGTQYRKKIGIGWKLELTKKMALDWFCELSQDYTNNAKQVSNVTQARVTYTFSPHIVASASFGHRGHTDIEQGIHVDDGVVSSFNFVASSF